MKEANETTPSSPNALTFSIPADGYTRSISGSGVLVKTGEITKFDGTNGYQGNAPVGAGILTLAPREHREENPPRP